MANMAKMAGQESQFQPWAMPLLPLLWEKDKKHNYNN
jgi:hypothetical protein